MRLPIKSPMSLTMSRSVMIPTGISLSVMTRHEWRHSFIACITSHSGVEGATLWTFVVMKSLMRISCTKTFFPNQPVELDLVSNTKRFKMDEAVFVPKV